MEECTRGGSDGAMGIAIPGHGQPLELQEPGLSIHEPGQPPKAEKESDEEAPLGDVKPEGPPRFVSTHLFENKE